MPALEERVHCPVWRAIEYHLGGATDGVDLFLERRHNEMKSNDIEYHQFTG